MNVTLSTTQCAILRSVFLRKVPYQSLSLLKAVLTGVNGPHSEREVAAARSKIHAAGYSPEGLLALLEIRQSDLSSH